MPKVSIITATYNSEEFIKETWLSIKNQSFTDWEWLITDDCSTDGTISILESLSQQDNRVRIFRNNVNSGAAVSRNLSLSQARGEFIAFIDSDDLWTSEKLSIQLAFMEREGHNFTFTGYSLISEAGNTIDKTIDVSRSQCAFGYRDMLLKKATLGCSTVMLRRTAFSDLTMPNIRTGQDYALWLKLLKSDAGKAFLIDKPLMHYRIVTNSISRNKIKKARRQWSIYREIENLSLPDTLYCFTNYVIRAFIR